MPATRITFYLALLVCVGSLTACKKAPPHTPLEEVAPLPDPTPPTEPAAADLASNSLEDTASPPRFDITPMEAATDDTASASDGANQPPPDPLAALPPLRNAPPLPPHFESLFQCVESNLQVIQDDGFARRLHVALATEAARFDAIRGQAVLMRATGRKPTADESAEMILAIAGWDLRRAVETSLLFADPALKQHALESLAAEVAALQPEAASAIVDLIPARIAREDFLLGVIQRLAVDHPAAARTLADRIIEPLLNDWAVALVASGTPPEQLEVALRQLETLENPVVLDWALLALADRLTRQDLASVDTILPKIQRSLIRDELLSRLALATVATDPDKALSITLRIAEPMLMRRSLDALARALLPHKPALGRFLIEKKRTPPLPPEVWLPWLHEACEAHPDDAPDMFSALLSSLSNPEVLAGLLACCPGAPRAVRSEASTRDLSDDRLTLCFICQGILPDLLVACRAMSNPALRDEAIRCALPRQLPASMAALTDALNLMTEPLMRDEAISAVTPELLKNDRIADAFNLALKITDPYVRARTLVPLLSVADSTLATQALVAYEEAFAAISDPWRRDDVLTVRVRLLWPDQPTAAWVVLGGFHDWQRAQQLLGGLVATPLPRSSLDDLLSVLPGGPAKALLCLQQIRMLSLSPPDSP